MKTEKELRVHHLYKFLCQHRLFDRFIKNVETTNSSLCHRNIALKKFLDKKGDIFAFLYECISIGGSFTWSRTIEGHDFWEILDDKERNHFRKVWEDYVRMHGGRISRTDTIY